jgi:poly(A) polymerase
VIDYVGGQQDLRDGVLRAIGNPDERFEEDHLRLLRAVRFAARFGLRIEPSTASAIGRRADMLRRISPERIAEELRQMLTPVTRIEAWRLLWEHKLVQVIMRLLPKDAAVPERLEPGRSLFLSLAPGTPVSFGVALAAAVLCYRWHARGFPAEIWPLLEKSQVQSAAHGTRQALKISNEELSEMSESLLGLAIVLSEPEPGVAGLKRFLARPAAAGSRALLKAIAARGHHAERAAWLRPRLDELAKMDFAPPPLLTGDDLTAAGQTPGPVFKRVLDAVYDAQLEGRVTTKAEALELGLALAAEQS